ncbi:MAG: transposase [Anaerolineae bacterium]|nr:transposase [Anaerolineae bacterium]
MPYDPQKHHRRSVRLPGYDYAQGGAYFVTICAYHQACLFGSVDQNAEMRLNRYGQIVERAWQQVATLRRQIETDVFVVMPNHVHGILIIHTPVGATLASPSNERPQGPPSGSLGAVVGGFKAADAREINRARQTPGAPVWQRSFHEVIIRSEAVLNRLRQYIDANPARWAEDRYYSSCLYG